MEKIKNKGEEDEEEDLFESCELEVEENSKKAPDSFTADGVVVPCSFMYFRVCP